MNCAKASALLGEHLEGDLALSTRAELDRHLSECGDCTRSLRERVTAGC